jgi:hypothetical protein
MMRGLAIAVMLVVAVRPARADDTIAKADKLFEEGRALMKSDLHAACEKFEESLKFNSQAIGTLMNVALCDEKLGRTASAVAKFSEARDRAKEGNMEVHLKAAEERLAELLPRVPHIKLVFAAPPLPDTRIVIDDKVIAMADIGDIAIDPGEHPLVVSAPNHLSYETRIRIAEGEHRDISVPALRSGTGSRRTIGKIVTISGGVFIASGVILGFLANNRYEDQFDGSMPNCDRATLQCNGNGQTETERARTLGVVGSVVGGVGVAAAAVGLYLWIRSPKESRDNRVTLLPHLTPGETGVVAVGRF